MDVLEGRLREADGDVGEAGGSLHKEQIETLAALCSALGGMERSETGTKYVKGIECLECVMELNRAARRDEDDNAVVHLLGTWNIVAKDLIPIMQAETDVTLLRACVRLLAVLTSPTGLWKKDVGAHMAYLHSYKENLSKNDVLMIFVHLLVAPLELSKEDRDDADRRTIVDILTIFRNLLHIPDGPRQNTLGQVQVISLHDQAIVHFHEAHVFDILVTLTSSVEDREHSDLVFDALLVETFFLAFHPYTPETLQSTESLSKKKSTSLLKEMIQKERIEESIRQETKNATLFSRHSRFGGTFLFQPESGDRFHIHKDVALVRNGLNMDLGKKPLTKTHRAVDFMDNMFKSKSHTDLSVRETLKQIGDQFLESCYNAMMGTSIRRFLRKLDTPESQISQYFWLIQFFLRYYHLKRTYKKKLDTSTAEGADETGYEIIASSIDLDPIRFLIRRIEQYQAEKSWNYLHVSVRCLKEVVRILLAMASSTNQASVDISKNLQHNLYYEGQLLNIIPDLLKSYHRQNKVYLTDLVELAHLFMKMYENFSTEKEYIFIQKKKRKSKPKVAKPAADGEEAPEETEVTATEQQGEGQEEHMTEDVPVKSEKDHEEKKAASTAPSKSFREEKLDFKIFQLRFANDKIISAYCSLLENFQENEDEVNLMIVKLFHRVFVKLNVQPLFYKLSIFALFREIFDSHLHTPAIDQLKKFFEYVLTVYFKAMETNPLLYLELLYPKPVADVNRIQFGTSRGKIPLMDVPEKKDAAAGPVEEEAAEEEPLQAETRRPQDLEIIGEPSGKVQLDAIALALDQERNSHYLLWLKKSINKALELRKAHSGDTSTQEQATFADFPLVAREFEEKAAVTNLYFRHMMKLFDLRPPAHALDHWAIPGTMTTMDLSSVEDRLGDLIYDPPDPKSLDVGTVFKKPVNSQPSAPRPEATNAKAKGKAKAGAAVDANDDFAKLRRLQELRRKARRPREEPEKELWSPDVETIGEHRLETLVGAVVVALLQTEKRNHLTWMISTISDALEMREDDSDDEDTGGRFVILPTNKTRDILRNPYVQFLFHKFGFDSPASQGTTCWTISNSLPTRDLLNYHDLLQATVKSPPIDFIDPKDYLRLKPSAQQHQAQDTGKERTQRQQEQQREEQPDETDFIAAVEETNNHDSADEGTEERSTEQEEEGEEKVEACETGEPSEREEDKGEEEEAGQAGRQRTRPNLHEDGSDDEDLEDSRTKSGASRSRQNEKESSDDEEGRQMARRRRLKKKRRLADSEEQADAGGDQSVRRDDNEETLREERDVDMLETTAPAAPHIDELDTVVQTHEASEIVHASTVTSMSQQSPELE